MRRLICTIAALLAPLAACGDDRTDPAGPDADTATPLYAVNATMFGAEGNTSYVALVESLDADQQIDYGRVLEVAGGSTIFGATGGALFALGGESAPTLTRFEIDAAGELVEGDRVSLAGLGIASTWSYGPHVPFAAPDRAFLIDEASLQLVAWNPAEMTLGEATPIEGIDEVGWSTNIGLTVPRVGDRLFYPVRYRNYESGAIDGRSSVLILDLATGETTALDDTRCGDLFHAVATPAGDVYVAGGVLGAAYRVTEGDAALPAPCLLRINAGETAFDPEFLVELSSLTGGRPTGSLVPGEGTEAFVRAFHAEEFEVGPGTDYYAVFGALAWRWYRIDLADPTAPGTLVDALPFTSAAGGDLEVAGTTYLTNASTDYSETTLVEMGAAGGPAARITVRGYPYNVIQVR